MNTGRESHVEQRARIDALERQVRNLQEAVDSRQRVGVVVGLLAYRMDCTPDQAWDLLIWISQTTNVKVRTVTQVLTDLHCGVVSPADAALAASIERLLPPVIPRAAAARISRRRPGPTRARAGASPRPRSGPPGARCLTRPGRAGEVYQAGTTERRVLRISGLATAGRALRPGGPRLVGCSPPTWRRCSWCGFDGIQGYK